MWNDFIRNKGIQVYLVPVSNFKQHTKNYFKKNFFGFIMSHSLQDCIFFNEQNREYCMNMFHENLFYHQYHNICDLWFMIYDFVKLF